MKKIIFINILICFISIIIHAQVEPSVTYDSSSGNYIIEYIGYEGEDQLPVIVRRIYEPTTKIAPFIQADIKNISDSNYYEYSYIVSNSASSKQRLRKFGIEIFSVINEISAPDENWRIGYYSFVPVFRWANSKGSGGLAHPLDGIAPDSSKTGFGFSSIGLPSISSAYFYGTTTIPLAFPDEPPGEISDLLKPLRKFPNNCVVKKTIGPKDAPSPFIPFAFLDTLIKYTTKSFELGWITDQTTRDKYLNYFNTAKGYLENADTNTARNELLKVLTDVDIDSSTSLSSEAYALIKFNTEYLLERL